MYLFNKNSETNKKEKGENVMNIIEHRVKESDISPFENNSVLLWLRQNLRKIQGKPLQQVEVLNKVVNEFKTDDNLLGILLFGSVASGTQTWKSDIDLILIFETCEPTSGLANLFVDGIAVQYFFVDLATLIENQETVPYLLHMFVDAKILFDRNSMVISIVKQLQLYFTQHPEVTADWIRFKELHQIDKKGSACQQTTIIQRWHELEEKYSDGFHKRTFLQLFE